MELLLVGVIYMSCCFYEDWGMHALTSIVKNDVRDETSLLLIWYGKHCEAS